MVGRVGAEQAQCLTVAMPHPPTAGAARYRELLVTSAMEAVNSNLAVGTAARYKASADLYRTMCFETGNSRSAGEFVPPTVALVVLYVAHLARRSIQASTVHSHLSGLRYEAMRRMCADPYVGARMPAVLAAAVVGFARLREMDPTRIVKVAVARLPVSPAMMLALMNQASISLSPFDAAMMRLTFLLAFFGANRMGELMVGVGKFDPRLNLIERRVTIVSEDDVVSVNVHLTASKTDRMMRGVNVRCVDFSGQFSVVVALTEWLRYRASVKGTGPDTAFFVSEAGTPLTTAKFRDLLNILCRATGLPVGIMPHSFRIGAASALIEGGASREMTMVYGRWTSSAVDLYIRQTAIDRKRLATLLMTSLL